MMILKIISMVVFYIIVKIVQDVVVFRNVIIVVHVLIQMILIQITILIHGLIVKQCVIIGIMNVQYINQNMDVIVVMIVIKLIAKKKKERITMDNKTRTQQNIISKNTKDTCMSIYFFNFVYFVCPVSLSFCRFLFIF